MIIGIQEYVRLEMMPMYDDHVKAQHRVDI